MVGVVPAVTVPEGLELTPVVVLESGDSWVESTLLAVRRQACLRGVPTPTKLASVMMR